LSGIVRKSPDLEFVGRRYPDRMHDVDEVVPLTHLTTVHGAFAARVLQARLADEGIESRLRGPVDSPYGFTVGELARIDVYVPTEAADDAAYVMLVAAVDDATDLPEPRFGRRTRWTALAALLVVVVAAVSPAVRYFAS
jgi:hypothetical protein